ncbi:hypothetical protein LCGC14_2588260 [marine sediment metagenome]|uniref:Uncharacterized protein n=1 Tax=marine sediment metagenome TaxID=412755 RepID=A0A0F9ACV3_9ZZZZ
MKPKTVQYTPSYFGITFDKKQLRLLRRIACEQAMPVGLFIRSCIQRGFLNLEQHVFSQGN